MRSTLRHHARLILMLTTYALPVQSMASGGGGEKDDGKPKYIDIKPALVSNFVADKIRFVKAEVVLKVKDMKHVEMVLTQMPLIKHQLLFMLASQQEETLVSPDGQANLKVQALEELNTTLEEELGESPEIMEVLFTGFLVE
jgi:flagellar FliL protein